MSKSENPVSSDLLKKVSNFIESSTYQENSFIFNPESLRRYGPSSRQTFIKVPKSKRAHLREDILVPEEKEVICDKILALELINDLKSSGDIIRNIVTIFESKVESDEAIDNENFYLAKLGINSLISRLLPLFCLGPSEGSGCQVSTCCEIKDDFQSLIVNEEYKTITVGKESDILQILENTSSTFTRSKKFELSKDDILEERVIELSRSTFKKFRSKSGFIHARCPVEDLKGESIVFRDNIPLRTETACGIITHVLGTEVIGAKKYHIDELLTYKNVPCTVVFISSDNFTKLLDGVMHPKNSGGEHLLTEAIEDRNEVNGAEVNVTIEFVEDQSDLVPEPAMEIEVASTSMATETEANLTSQPIVQIEVSSDVTSLELVNPEGNPFDVFASAEEIYIETSWG